MRLGSIYREREFHSIRTRGSFDMGSSILAGVLVAVAALSACSQQPSPDSISPSTTQPTAATGATPLTGPTTSLPQATVLQSTTTLTTLSDIVPTRFAGSTTDGERLVIVELLDGRVETVQQWTAPQAIADAVLTESGVVVSTCCEPAASTRWTFDPAREAWTEIGYGTTVDTGPFGVLTVETNGGYLQVSKDATDSTIQLDDFVMPLDASFFPNGDIAIVALGEDYALYVSPLSDSVLDTTRIWVTSEQLGGGALNHPVVDADGRVWLIVDTDDRQVRIVVDGPGSYETIQPSTLTTSDITDQSFDPTGTFLLTAYEDGTVTLRRYNSPDETKLEVPRLDRVNW